ncbi:hypothetical protein [Pseudomonas sp. UMAB-40]|uniref:hypothetical protein n=1 Tax=Pseudomonas sp. UMAB-40 TaxID=1365407 RepID=UPI001C5961E9|nr:hypothetical protein [Pseudomonas sp. UMAB-40]
MTVQKITLEDRGQDFTEWYVRDGVVIDCQPFQGRVWVGTKVLNAINPRQPNKVVHGVLGERREHPPHDSDIKSGSLLEIVRKSGAKVLLDYAVVAVEILSPAEAAKVEEFGRKWADMQGIARADLGL